MNRYKAVSLFKYVQSYDNNYEVFGFAKQKHTLFHSTVHFHWAIAKNHHHDLDKYQRLIMVRVISWSILSLYIQTRKYHNADSKLSFFFISFYMPNLLIKPSKVNIENEQYVKLILFWQKSDIGQTKAIVEDIYSCLAQ